MSLPGLKTAVLALDLHDLGNIGTIGTAVRFSYKELALQWQVRIIDSGTLEKLPHLPHSLMMLSACCTLPVVPGPKVAPKGELRPDLLCEGCDAAQPSWIASKKLALMGARVPDTVAQLAKHFEQRFGQDHLQATLSATDVLAEIETTRAMLARGEWGQVLYESVMAKRKLIYGELNEDFAS